MRDDRKNVRALMMRWRGAILQHARWLFPLTTACVIGAALIFPQMMLYQWERREMNVIRQEAVDTARVMTGSVLSGSDRLYLFRLSGISARDGKIVYREGAPIERRTIDLKQTAVDNEAAADSGNNVSVKEGNSKNASRDISPALSELMLMYGEQFSLYREEVNESIAERVNEYLSYTWSILESFGAFGKKGFGGLLIYAHDIEDIQVDYCTVIDDNPYFSLSLLCITCTMDQEKYGLMTDSSISFVADEESGMIYAVSMTGAPKNVLTDDPLAFLLLADMLGVACTDFSLDVPQTTPPSAYFNFGGYLYRLEQSTPREDYAVFNFNMERGDTEGGS